MKKILSLLFILLILPSAFAQTKIDEYGAIYSDDELARLYNTRSIIEKEPESKAYFIIHKPKDMPLGRFLRRFYGVERMWKTWLKYNPELIEMVAGEEMKEIHTEIWQVSESTTLPNVKTISLEAKLKESITEKTLFDYDCIDCDDDPPRNLSIFHGDGLKFYAEALKANPNSRALILLSYNYQIKEIRNILTKDYGIEAKRVKIQIKPSLPIYTSARFYIVPTKSKAKN